MIIYTPREFNNYNNDIMMVEEQPLYTYRRRSPFQSLMSIEHPFDSMFRTVTKRRPRIQKRITKRPRRSFFESFFDDEFFGHDDLFESFFPTTLRRLHPVDESDKKVEIDGEENKENEVVNGEKKTEDEKDESKPVKKTWSRVITQEMTRDENGNIHTIKKEKLNKNGKVKETQEEVVCDEKGEIKEEKYFLNGQKVEKMAIENKDTDDEEDDDWVIRPIEN